MRSTTPTYRIEYTRVYNVSTGRFEHWGQAGWDCKRSGRATEANLRTHLRGMEASTLPGGCNAHLGTTQVCAARLVHQASGRVVASYSPAAFEVVA